jgi:hypothetical protein
MYLILVNKVSVNAQNVAAVPSWAAKLVLKQ